MSRYNPNSDPKPNPNSVGLANFFFPPEFWLQRMVNITLRFKEPADYREVPSWSCRDLALEVIATSSVGVIRCEIYLAHFLVWYFLF